MGLLSAGCGGDIAESGAGVMLALESLRGLSEARLESVCADEAAAFAAVSLRMSGLQSCVGAEVVSGCLALVTLGCRNGNALCGTVAVSELGQKLTVGWIKHMSLGGDDYAAGAASFALWYLIFECASKMLAELRVPLEKAATATKVAKAPCTMPPLLCIWPPEYQDPGHIAFHNAWDESHFSL